MKNICIVTSLDTRRKKSDNTFPIIYRISYQQKTISISTGISVQEKDWDKNKRAIKSSYKGTESVSRLNNIIQKHLVMYIDKLTKLEEENQLNKYSLQEIKDILEKKEKKTSLFEYYQSIIDACNQNNQFGNARSYKMSLHVLKVFRKQKDLSFSEFTYDLLKKFEAFHLSKEGNTINGLSYYMRSFRAVYNKAVQDGIVNREQSPFLNYKIKSNPTKKRAISIDHIQKIEALHLEPNDPLNNAKHYFIASYYLMGISFIDLAFLKKENIIDQRIQYNRQKTHKPYNIKITPKLQTILDYYSTIDPNSPFIFPILRTEKPEEQFKRIHNERKKFNDGLKKLAELCEIKEKLTSYVSRHSFATIAKHKGIPVTAISEMLGHSDLKTTQIYLDSLASNVIDDFHLKVLE